jgi:SAM-dependent methyltransferase
VSDPDVRSVSTDREVPIGLVEIVAAVADAPSVLDVGCGSGRLTVALARTGAAVTGADASRAVLDRAGARAREAGVELGLVLADFNDPLPFEEAAFDAITSRLSLMVARDPVATLRELARLLAPDGRIATAIWAPIEENPWFGVPRDAIVSVLGPDRGTFARPFGRHGEPDAMAALHRAAGLRDVDSTVIAAPVRVPDAATHWARLAASNGHYRRVDAALGDDERHALEQDLATRLEPFRDGDQVVLARTLVLVTARR